MSRQKDMSWKVEGLNPSAGKSFFSHEISIEVYFYEHLALKFKHVRYLQCFNCLLCIYCNWPPNLNKILKELIHDLPTVFTATANFELSTREQFFCPLLDGRSYHKLGLKYTIFFNSRLFRRFNSCHIMPSILSLAL